MSSHSFAPAPGRRTAASSARALPTALVLFVGIRLLALVTLVALAHARDMSAYVLLTKWDAQWYRHIAKFGYGYTKYREGHAESDYAFFPLFPMLERGIGAVTGMPFAAAGLVVAVVSSLLAAWGIYSVASHLYGARVGVVATVLWAALPIGLVQWMSYSESLFTALAAWSLRAVLGRRWVLAGVLASLAGLTRPLGVAVAAAVVIAAVKDLWSGSRDRRDLRPVAGALLAPLGAVGYLGWVSVQVGSMTGYFAVEGGWGNRLDGGVRFAHWTWGLLAGPHPEYGLLVVLGVVAVLGALLWTVLERQPLPLLIYSAAIVAVALATSRYFGSKPRYLMPAFPLLLPFARLLADRRPWLTRLLLGLLIVGSAAFGAVWLLTPGAP